jgi:hypothetical protein
VNNKTLLILLGCIFAFFTAKQYNQFIDCETYHVELSSLKSNNDNLSQGNISLGNYFDLYETEVEKEEMEEDEVENLHTVTAPNHLKLSYLTSLCEVISYQNYHLTHLSKVVKPDLYRLYSCPKSYLFLV